MSLRGASAIVGVGLAEGTRRPGFHHLELLAEAAHRALAEAGLRTRDVDGLFAATAVDGLPTLAVGEYLGIRPRFADGTNLGGASFEAFALTATMALALGLCEVALVCYGSTLATGGHRAIGRAQPNPYEEAYRPRFPISDYALVAARHFHQYGTTREQLAEVAVAARHWARLNPEAAERGPLTIADVLAARVVADPLTVRDCCLMTDGGGAVVLVAGRRAPDLAARPVYFLGGAAAQSHCSLSSMPDLTVTAAHESGQRAFAMAGLRPADVDVAELYDAFSINTLLFLEDLGFCAKGEGGPFVTGGAIAPGGRLPVNTNGGGLSCMHPGMYGIFLLVEAVRQLRGAAGARQVPGARVALCHGNGYVLSSQVTTLWGTRDVL